MNFVELPPVAVFQDEYESDEDAFASQSSPSKSPAKTVQKEYQLKNVLSAPRPVQYSASHLYEMIELKDIDLDAEYQREVVWNESKQSKIIDSILRNFYVPPILFRVIDLGNGVQRRVCLDGKQRLTSITRFMKGEIPHRDSDTNRPYWFKADPNSDSNRNLLPEVYLKSFKMKQFTCIEYHDLEEEYEREIFQRVQLGMPLTVAERMQALQGPWPDFAREVQRRYFDHGFDELLSLKKDRAESFRRSAELICYIYNAKDGGSAVSAHQLQKFIGRVDPPTNEFRTVIIDVVSTYLSIAQDQNLSHCFRGYKTVAPIEFLMGAVLVALHKEKLSPGELSAAISGMRNDVRSKEKDIFSNKRIHDIMRSYVEFNAPGFGSGKRRAPAANDADVDMGAGEDGAELSPRKKKRREEKDPEYRGEPIHTPTRARYRTRNTRAITVDDSSDSDEIMEILNATNTPTKSTTPKSPFADGNAVASTSPSAFNRVHAQVSSPSRAPNSSSSSVTSSSIQSPTKPLTDSVKSLNVSTSVSHTSLPARREHQPKIPPHKGMTPPIASSSKQYTGFRQTTRPEANSASPVPQAPQTYFIWDSRRQTGHSSTIADQVQAQPPPEVKQEKPPGE